MANGNPMREIRLDKVVVNMGIGSEENLLPNAKMLLEKLTGHQPVATYAKKRAPEFKIRKGQAIGAVVTLRNKDARDMLSRAIDAVENTLKETAIANNSLSFGVVEYIYFSGIKYDPKIGMLGVNINASFSRKGRRVELRKRKAAVQNKRHSMIPKEEIINYISKNFNAKVAGAEK